MIEEYRYYPIVPNPDYVEGGNEPQEIWGDIKENGEYQIEPSTDDCIAMENVVVKVNVPQNASVLNMDNTTNSEEPPFVPDEFNINGKYDISQWNEAHNTNYVGFNPVNVKVPNMIAVPKIFKKNTTNPYTIHDWEIDPDNSNIDNKNEYIGFTNIQVDVPNVTIPVEEPNNPEDTPMNTIVTRRENGKYTINQWKLEHLNDTTTEQRNSVVGLSEIMINVPNKVVTPTNISSNTNDTTITIANWKLNEGANVPDKDDYVGFDNISVNVQPKLLTDQPINIPNNNYVLNINSYWNNNHPNDLKDGFNNIIIHYDDSGSNPVTDSEVAENPVMSQQTALINRLLVTLEKGEERKDVLLQQSIMNNDKLSELENKRINFTNNVMSYLLTNKDNQGNVTNFNHWTLNQNKLAVLQQGGDPRYIQFPQDVTNGGQIQGNVPMGQIQGAADVHINMLMEGEQPVAQEQVVPFNYTNTSLESDYDPTQPTQQRMKRLKMGMRDVLPLFSDVKLYSKFIDSILDYNEEFGTEYYGCISQKKKVEIEMLDYDSIEFTANTITQTGDKYENGSYIYDIVSDFIEDVDKNPVIPNDPNFPDGPGHYTYNPVGLRRLKIKVNVPQSQLRLETSDASHRIVGNVDFNNSSVGTAMITALPNYDGFYAPLYLTLNGSNFPSDVDNADVNSQNNNIIISRTGTYTIPNGKTGWNSFSVNVPSDVDNYIGYDQNNRYSITQSGDGVITVPSGKTGLGEVYYNVSVQPDNYIGYDQNNRYLITQSGDGVITIPSGKTGLGDVYYTVNIQPPSPPVSTPNIYYTVLFNSGSGNNVYIISGYDFTEELDNIGIDCNNMRSLYCAFYKVNGCATIVERVTDVINSDYATSMSKMFNGCYSLTSVPLFNTSSVTTMSSMFEDCYSLISIPLFNTSNVTNMSKMFKNCYSLTSVPLFGTSNVTNMNEMFYACYSLKTVPLFDTSSVTNMVDMFLSCASLTSVPLFDTSNVTNMTEMFYGCHSLKTVPLFNTSKVTDMTSMFFNCYYLTSVPLFDTYRVTKMNSMFNSCYSLTSVSLFDTSGVTDMSRMFFVCRSLTSVPLFDTLNVTDMTSMFSNCSSLTSVPLFNTSNVKTMTKMFYSCDSLTSVPLFNTSKVTNMTTMFYSCDSLISVPLFNTSKVTDMNETFNGCTSLSNESLNNILKMCTDSLVSASNKKLNSYVKVSSDYNSIIPSLSNYNDFIAAGWSLS